MLATISVELVSFYFTLACGVFLFIKLSASYKIFSLLLTLIMIPLFPLLADTSDWIWFDWAKRYSVLCIMLIISSVQYWHQKTGRTNLFIQWSTLYLLPFILLGNILEGVMVDFFAHNYLNVAVGVLLVALIPNFWGKWHINKNNIVGFGAYWDWCVLYTLWNAYLIVGNGGTVFQNIYIPALIILGINLFLRDWHDWFSTRAYCIFLIASLDSLFPSLLPNIQLSFSTPVLRMGNFEYCLCKLGFIYDIQRKTQLFDMVFIYQKC